MRLASSSTPDESEMYEDAVLCFVGLAGYPCALRMTES